METTETISNSKRIGGIISITVDIIMIIIAVVNLTMIIFDSFFKFQFFQSIIESISSDFYVFYRDTIHPDFLLYDLFFVSIFVTELIIQWIVSIIFRTYPKWWIYPIANWYDVLGCIPIGSFIWLRLLRIIAIAIRLHKIGTINLRKGYFYKTFYSYYSIFIQDAADKVMVIMLDAAKRAVAEPAPTNKSDEHQRSILRDAIKPDQHELARVLAAKIHEVIDKNYHAHRDDMKEQIHNVIHEGFEKSVEMQKMENIPLIGRMIYKRLERTLDDITFQLVDSLSHKLASEELAEIIEQMINTSLDAFMKKNKDLKIDTGNDKELGKILQGIASRALEQIKDDIEYKRKHRKTVQEPVDYKPDLEIESGDKEVEKPNP